MNHTPTPWHVEYDKNDPDEVHGIRSGDIQIVETDSGYYPPYKEDAAYIVKCVNAHEALLEALYEISNLIDRRRWDIAKIIALAEDKKHE